MIRLLAAAIILITAAIAGVMAWPQLFGLSLASGVAQIVALRGIGIVAAGILVIVLILAALLTPKARRFAASLAVVALAFAAINAAVLATRGFGSPTFPSKGDDGEITVLAWNTLEDTLEAATVAETARETGADIVILPETTHELGQEIAQAMRESATMRVHTLAYDNKALSTTLLITAELGDYRVDTVSHTTSVPTLVATPSDSTRPTIIAAHTTAPLPSTEAAWEKDLLWLEQRCRGNVIMAGDFNATLDHFAGLPHSEGAELGECQDAALVTDNAAVGTWPTQLPALLGTPIDHILATKNWTVTGMRVIESHDKEGSDHRPVLAQLSLSR